MKGFDAYYNRRSFVLYSTPAKRPRLVRPREHARLSGLALLERDDLRRRALGERVLADERPRVERVRVLEERVPVLGDEAVAEHADLVASDTPNRGDVHFAPRARVGAP